MSLRRNPDIVLRKVHGSYFLIDIADNYSGDKCSIYEVNQTGVFIWDNIDGNREIDDLVALLSDAITDDIDRRVLRSDVDEFTSDLLARSFVEA